MTVTRRQAREWVIQILTAADLNPQDSSEQIIGDFWEQLRTLDAEDGGTNGAIPHGKMKLFVEERVIGVLGECAALDARIEPLLADWKLYRLGTVERAVLRLGAWEILHSDVPAPVVINEAVDLANWYSSPKSRPLVNGILDKLAKDRAGKETK